MRFNPFLPINNPSLPGGTQEIYFIIRPVLNQLKLSRLKIIIWAIIFYNYYWSWTVGYIDSWIFFSIHDKQLYLYK